MVKKLNLVAALPTFIPLSYEDILNGNGFGLDDAKVSIDIVHQIREQKPIGLKGSYHQLAELPLTEHPFGRNQQIIANRDRRI